MILSRDVTSVCDYFAGQGVKCDAEAEMRRLWGHYLARSPRDLAADHSRFEVAEAD